MAEVLSEVCGHGPDHGEPAGYARSSGERGYLGRFVADGVVRCNGNDFGRDACLRWACGDGVLDLLVGAMSLQCGAEVYGPVDPHAGQLRRCVQYLSEL